MKNIDLSEISKVIDQNSHAKKLSNNWMPSDYDEIVDESILNVNFKPDIFQKQSFYFLQKHESVFVSAHTSSGKTLVAEYAIHLAEKRGSRVIYTSPIKALSNQKFYDFKSKFENVGLITGDVQVNPEASCLIMTTEILRNMVYKNSDLLRSTDFVIFDEVHYINDADRGVVWEECIIMLPKHICFVMLSATIPNSMEFSEWVGRAKERCIYVITTEKRAVPLEFTIYSDSSAYSIFDSKKSLSNFKEGLIPYSKKRVASSSRFRINDLGHFVTNRKLTPAIFFSFSKKSCEEYGNSLQHLDLTSPLEKNQIRSFLKEALNCLNDCDKYLPQITRMSEQVVKGIAVHHGSLLPFVKECVEILFSQNLIKILVATETFAMGVNMPAKCCVFLSLTKIDNGKFRYLETGEFIQMSGRAGRRGMDRVGTVIIADQRNPPLTTIKNVICGIQMNLNSQFKLSFSLILMALRGNITVENLMRNSFKEHFVQKGFTEDMTKLSKLQNKKFIDCLDCNNSIIFLQILKKILSENYKLILMILKEGDIILTKFNCLQKVIKINSNKIQCVPYISNENILNEKYFNQKILNNSDEYNIKKNFLKYSPKYISNDFLENILPSDIAFLIDENKISFNYKIKSIDEILKMRELESNWNFLKELDIPCNNHYHCRIDQLLISDEIEYIKSKYSENNLMLMNEYNCRIKFLRKRGFLEENTITLKGRVAAEIRTVNDILVTELCFGNAFGELNSVEILAIMSSMITEENLEEFEIEKDLEYKFDKVKEFFDELQKDADIFEIPNFPILDFSLAQAVYDWAKGLSLGKVVAKHGVQEGSFVRLILRLDECCREMVNATNLMGDKELEAKFLEGSSMIKRDIVFLPSLYI